ncbi:hypothetical protein LguiA_013021 [Lonicera macranthoides]
MENIQSNMPNASQSNNSTHILVDDVTPDPPSIDSENKDVDHLNQSFKRIVMTELRTVLQIQNASAGSGLHDRSWRTMMDHGDDMVPKFGNHKFDPEVEKALFAQMIARHDYPFLIAEHEYFRSSTHESSRVVTIGDRSEQSSHDKDNNVENLSQPISAFTGGFKKKSEGRKTIVKKENAKMDRILSESKKSEMMWIRIVEDTIRRDKDKDLDRSGTTIRPSSIEKNRIHGALPMPRPKMVNQLRLYARYKVERGRVQEEGPKKKSISIPRPETRKTPQTTPQSTSKKRIPSLQA